MPSFRLRDLGPGARLGLACMLLVLLGGMAASFTHLFWHHQNRDERPGLSMDDIQGVYHGVVSTSPLLKSLREGHPEDLPAPSREALLRWLEGPRISEDYDSLDLGDAAPVEIIARSCVRCHARGATEGEGIGRRVPLEFFDDVRRIAFSREIKPMAIEILAVTTHTHALSLGMLTIVVGALLWLTSWPRRLVSAALFLAGAALLADLASWWLARDTAAFTTVIAIAGGIYNALVVLMILAVLLDLCLPRRAA